jgi:hypothetical protein
VKLYKGAIDQKSDIDAQKLIRKSHQGRQKD